MRDSLAIKKLLYESSSPLVLCAEKANQEVQEGKDQETAQSEKDSHSKTRGGKKLN